MKTDNECRTLYCKKRKAVLGGEKTNNEKRGNREHTVMICMTSCRGDQGRGGELMLGDSCMEGHYQ